MVKKQQSQTKCMLAAAVLAVGTQAIAAPTNPEYTWNGGSSGTWDTGSSSWLDSGSASVAWTNATKTNARLTTASANITIGTALTVGAIEFVATGDTLSATVARTITVNEDATLSGGRPASISVASGTSATIGDYVTVGGDNTYVVGGGTLNLSSSDPATKPGGTIKFSYGPLAIQQGSTVNVFAGGTINVATGVGTSGQIELGDISYTDAAGTNNTLNVLGGTVVTGGAIELGRSGSTNATLNISSGSVSCSTLRLYAPGTAADNSTVTLAGGTLSVASVAKGAGSGGTVFNFDGGTLRPTATSATFWSSSNLLASANVKAGGAKIDTQTFDITIAQPLVHFAGLGATPDGGLTKSSAGILTLSGASTYTGVTTVTGGTLAVTGSIASTKLNVVAGVFDAHTLTSIPSLTSLAGAGTVTAPSSGIVLAATGTLSPGGTTIAPGDQAGTLIVAGNLTLSSGAKFVFDLGATSDRVSMASSTLTLNGQQFSDFTFHAPAGGYVNGATYVLFDAGAFGGALNGDLASLSGSLDTGVTGILSLDNVNHDLVMTVSIPEPATLGLLGISAAALLSMRRRRA